VAIPLLHIVLYYNPLRIADDIRTRIELNKKYIVFQMSKTKKQLYAVCKGFRRGGVA